MTNLLTALKRIAKGNVPSFAGLRRHETEIHGMHGARRKLHCPIPTCKRHTGEGFQRKEHQPFPQPSCAMAHED